MAIDVFKRFSSEGQSHKSHSLAVLLYLLCSCYSSSHSGHNNNQRFTYFKQVQFTLYNSSVPLVFTVDMLLLIPVVKTQSGLIAMLPIQCTTNYILKY